MSAELVTHLRDLLVRTPWAGKIQSKRMFGGFGLFDGARMVGLIADDTLYLKADDDNRHQYTELGLPPFTYNKKGVEFSMSYFQAPAESLEDGDELAKWLSIAAGAAARAAAKKPRKARGKATTKTPARKKAKAKARSKKDAR